MTKVRFDNTDFFDARYIWPFENLGQETPGSRRYWPSTFVTHSRASSPLWLSMGIWIFSCSGVGLPINSQYLSKNLGRCSRMTSPYKDVWVSHRVYVGIPTFFTQSSHQPRRFATPDWSIRNSWAIALCDGCFGLYRTHPSIPKVRLAIRATTDCLAYQSIAPSAAAFRLEHRVNPITFQVAVQDLRWIPW